MVLCFPWKLYRSHSSTLETLSTHTHTHSHSHSLTRSHPPYLLNTYSHPHPHTLTPTQLEEMRSNHERHVAEVERLVEDKDERISELLTNLKQLRGDIGSAHLPDGSVVASVGGLRPPGLARRTATIGVQTSEELLSDSEPAILPVDVSVGGANSVLTNGERATMMSLGPDEEVPLVRIKTNVSSHQLCLNVNCIQ